MKAIDLVVSSGRPVPPMNRRRALAGIASAAGAAVVSACARSVTAQVGSAPRLTIVPDIAGPDPLPRAPRFKAPSGTCDTHCHIFGPVAEYPYADGRPYTPPEAPLEALRRLHARIGVDRGVIVNATPYGRDNRVVLDAIGQSRGTYRGIGNVDDRTTERELEALAEGGLDGCRFTFLSRLGGRPDMQAFGRVVERIRPLGWHVDLYLEASSLGELAPRLATLPVSYVIDHMGVVDAALGVEQPAFRALLALLARDEKCWVKITGPERVSAAGPPFLDALPFAQQLIQTAPDRVLWGTDWPHPNVRFMPNDGDLMDLVPRFAPDPAVQRRLLVDNPSRLFRFRA